MLLTTQSAAASLGIEPATLRHHLRKMACFPKHGQSWLLTERDLPKVRRFIEAARKAKGFQPGNQHAKGR